MTREGQTRRIIRDQNFKGPATLELHSSELYIAQKPYPLDQGEYVILTKSRTRLEIAAYTLVWGSAIFGIGVLGKLINAYFSKEPSNIDRGALIALLIAFIASGFLFMLNAIWPSERRQISKKIRKHFRENEKFTGIMK